MFSTELEISRRFQLHVGAVINHLLYSVLIEVLYRRNMRLLDSEWLFVNECLDSRVLGLPFTLYLNFH